MAEPIDYLKTYLNMNPEDYSRMQAQIGGETLPEREIFNLQAPVMPKPMPMPTSRQAMEPMPMPAPQNTQVQGLMDEIASLKAQIEAMQDTPESMPVVEEAPVMPSAPAISDLQNRMAVEPMPMPTSNVLQAPPELTNRMVGEPQPIPQRSPVSPLPAEQIQKSLDILANIPKMNIPIIPDMEEIRQKMADANIPFSAPISFQEQLQTIKDLPSMPPVTPMPQAIKQMQMAMQNIPTPVAPVSSMPRFNLPKMQSFGSPRMATGELNIDQGYLPQRFAGGGLSKALSDLKTRIS